MFYNMFFFLYVCFLLSVLFLLLQLTRIRIGTSKKDFDVLTVMYSKAEKLKYNYNNIWSTYSSIAIKQITNLLQWTHQNNPVEQNESQIRALYVNPFGLNPFL